MVNLVKQVNFLPDIFPKEWSEILKHTNLMMFRNLDHFKHEVKKITQQKDNNCGMSYEKALSMLLKNESDFDVEKQESIRNLVRSNLFKRGLITEEIYENYRYSTDGTKIDVDYGKYCAGEADCVITPTTEYIDFFYELFISISYDYRVQDSSVKENLAKLLATIEELERQRIFIKITLVLPAKDSVYVEKYNNFFSYIPLFSHKELKSVEIMSAVINERLLRKFYFALMENAFKKNLAPGYGKPLNLPNAMNIGYEFNEIEFFEEIVKKVGKNEY